MRCKNCGRDLEPIVPNGPSWHQWSYDYKEGVRFRHVVAPTKYCWSGRTDGPTAAIDESSNIVSILEQYDL